MLIWAGEDLLEAHLPAWLRGVLERGILPAGAESLLTNLAQRAEERRSALVRRRLLASEQTLEEALGFSGRGT